MTEINNNDTINVDGFDNKTLENLAIWHHQRSCGMSIAHRAISKVYSNKYKFVDIAFNGMIKAIVDSCDKRSHSRETALDVVYAYSTSKDKDVMKNCTYDIIDYETGNVIEERYKYKEITELVNNNLMPVWCLGCYKIYDLENGRIIREVEVKKLMDIYDELMNKENEENKNN